MSGRESLFPDVLRFEPEPETVIATDDGVGRIKFYESSVKHSVTGEPLIALYSHGRGMRLTQKQAFDLYTWLGEWLPASAPAEKETR